MIVACTRGEGVDGAGRIEWQIEFPSICFGVRVCGCVNFAVSTAIYTGFEIGIASQIILQYLFCKFRLLPRCHSTPAIYHRFQIFNIIMILVSAMS